MVVFGRTKEIRFEPMPQLVHQGRLLRVGRITGSHSHGFVAVASAARALEYDDANERVTDGCEP